MGEPRTDRNTPENTLQKIALRMQDLIESAPNDFYDRERLFEQQSSFKLITMMIKLNEVFANWFWKRGY